jgi:hypothetical protein
LAGEHPVELAGDQPLLIEGAALEAERPDLGGNGGEVRAQPIDVGPGDLDAGLGAVVSDPHINESVAIQRALRGLDLPELLDAHRLAVGQAGAQARAGRFLMIRQPEMTCQSAHLSLVDAAFGERRADLEGRGGAQTGTIITEVVAVRPVQQRVARMALRKGGEIAVEVGLAVPAPIRRIRGIVGVIDLAGLDQLQGDVIALAEGDGLVAVLAFEAR